MTRTRVSFSGTAQEIRSARATISRIFSRILQGQANRPLMDALVNFDKPLVASVHGAAIGGGTTMLTHCDFIYAAESTKFQMPFINLAVVPHSASTCSTPARTLHTRPPAP